MIITALVFLLILSVLVLVHEFGHFLVAKKLGIKVEEFGFGFPPKAFGFKKGETEYTINWLPIGGFVKLYGEDEAGGGRIGTKSQISSKTADLKRAFFARPAWQRFLVAVAGVVMNTILAVVIYYGYFAITNFKAELPNLGEYNFLLADTTQKIDGVIIRKVSNDSPAQQAGLSDCSRQSCYRVIALNGTMITSSRQFSDTISKNKGKEITLSVENIVTFQKKDISLTPRKNPPKNQGAMGVEFMINESLVLSYNSPLQKTLSGIVHPVNIMLYQLDIIGKIIAFSFQERTIAPVGDAVSGPVGIFSHVGNVIQIAEMRERILQLLNLAGLLSISLAFFNVLPIPALDGGRIFFIVVEWITGKKVPEKIEGMIHAAGMAILLTLIALVTFKDILQLL